MIAYIREQGAKISREGQRLIVSTPDMKRTLFVEQLEQLLLFGNVQLTPPALLFLLREDVDTVFLRADGRYMGRLSGREPANVFLRKRQFVLMDDQAFCLKVGRRIVQAKLANQATVMARIRRARGKPQAGEAATALRELARKADALDDLDALRGLEGSGAALYFKHLPLAFTEDWGFTRRVRRPPTDPVNAVLSLLYTLLINRCCAAVRIAGLDPYPAALHRPTYGRQCLPLDLVEEFRAMLADTLTIALFNLRVLGRNDFEAPAPEPQEELLTADPAEQAALQEPLGAMTPQCSVPDVSALAGEQTEETPGGHVPGRSPVLLRHDAFKRVLTIFARKMETEFHHPAADRQMTYNDALVFQARQYRRLVEGEADAYLPLMLR
ncbi:CRISPR-associated endonuclease Cas1 [Desulfovibrio legallii]|uniref:CRISPR-associated endonuclease Cas1 n=1 Tax=Desulfovibrio legallii TaxID=571438 RepID=A0A1G7K093_9BACT|nr:CRISPR-associated endonuclease Cas1 [Desulfovibrio legallii]SDF30550.1 CRISP-associated protein Cas1 [Desulfovibrio legallii]